MKVSLIPTGDIDAVVKGDEVAIHERIVSVSIIDEKTGTIILDITDAGEGVRIQTNKKLVRLAVDDSILPTRTDLIIR